MSLNTVMREDVRDILTAIRISNIDTAIGMGVPADSAGFFQGYQAALDAVAVALGLRLPSPKSLSEKRLGQQHKMCLQPSFRSMERS